MHGTIVYIIFVFRCQNHIYSYHMPVKFFGTLCKVQKKELNSEQVPSLKIAIVDRQLKIRSESGKDGFLRLNRII